MDFVDLAKERKSCRRFSSKVPDWREVIECIDSVRYSPMAGNNFSLKFVLVKDKKKIEKIAKATQQDFVSKAPYLVVFCSNPTPTVRGFGDRGYDYLRQQAGAGIQTFLLALTQKGIESCWVGHFVNNLVKEELSIPDKIEVEAIIAVGYEGLMKTPRTKKINLDNVLFFDKYKEKNMK
jgi:nitroreductase